MTDDELDEADRLVDAATDGPWTWDRLQLKSPGQHTVITLRDGGCAADDTALIAAAPTLLRKLTAEVRWLRGERDAVYAEGLANGIERGTAIGKYVAGCQGEPHICDQEAIAAAEGKTDRLIIERDAYRTMVADLLASATPNKRDNPCMFAAWERAEKLLNGGPK